VRSSSATNPLVLRLIAIVVFVALVLVFVVFRPSPTKGSMVGVLATRTYGSVLVVKGGPLAGFPLYEFSGDIHGQSTCGTTRTRGYDLNPAGAEEMTCTGPMSDMINDVTSDDWPALTSSVKPVAEKGVNQKLLGTVYRRGVGRQVTYAGHPLYLFDPSSAPFKPLGEDYLETVAPLAPWHGYWTLVSAANGNSDTGATLMEVGLTHDDEHVLAVEGDPNINPLAVTVYTFSKGTCASCAPEWTPVLATTTPLVRGLNPHSVSTVRLADGSFQVTYDHQPLYEYSKEQVFLARDGSLASSGTAANGNGLRSHGGTFSVVQLAS
jgi:predicted lipoprotein with Yx(FWY)xxD motif